MEIKEALAQLDTLEDEHWTTDGLPKTEAVSELVGKKVSRSEITDAAPKFTRGNTDLEDVNDETEEETTVSENEPEQTEIDMSALEFFANSEPMSQGDFVEHVLTKTEPSTLPQIEVMLVQQQQVLDEKERELEELKRRVKLNLAATRLWIKRLVPDMSNQEAIQAYIRSSTNQRMNKAEKIQQVLGGLKPSDIAKLDPRAPIDRAFARKTGRGGARPTR